MFEKSISQIEGFFPLIWLGFCGFYWYQTFLEDWERIFEYDIYSFLDRRKRTPKRAVASPYKIYIQKLRKSGTQTQRQ